MVTAKRVLITGGNCGIGLESARQLLQLGHHVIITCRDGGKAEKALDTLTPIAKASGASVESELLDLASLTSVRHGAAKLLERHSRLDVLLCNAGIMSQVASGAPLQLTPDGQEMTLQVNHLGHFLLVHLLMPALLASQAGRVVVVSSELHRKATATTNAAAAAAAQAAAPANTPGSIASSEQPPPMLTLPLASPEWLTRLSAAQGIDATAGAPPPRCSLSGMQLYGISKLYNLWFAYRLAVMLPPNITCNAVTPGWVPGTSLGRGVPWLARVAYQTLFPLLPFTVSVREGARRVVSVCVGEPEGAARGRYFSRGVATDSSPESHDEATATELWRRSEEAAGLGAGMPYLPQTQPQAAPTAALRPPQSAPDAA